MVAGAGAVGSIVGTYPEIGTEARLPTTVVLRIATSPPWWPMPNVIGLGDDDAILALESSGLKVSEVRYERLSGLPPYQVAAQQPLAGDSVDVNTYVRIMINLPPENASPDPGAGAGGVQLLGDDLDTAPGADSADPADADAPGRRGRN
jgi:beta-lactam-binding protein with PASTA domain